MSEIKAASVDTLVAMLNDFYKENKTLRQNYDYLKGKLAAETERTAMLEKEVTKWREEAKRLQSEVEQKEN